MINESIIQEYTAILNEYVLNNRVSKYARQKLIELQGEIKESTIIVISFNRSSRQKITKDIVELNSIINQLDIIGMHRLLQQKKKSRICIFFSSSHVTFTKTDHIRNHKIHLSKFKIREIVQCQLSDHNAFKVEIKNKNSWKIPNT